MWHEQVKVGRPYLKTIKALIQPRPPITKGWKDFAFKTTYWQAITQQAYTAPYLTPEKASAVKAAAAARPSSSIDSDDEGARARTRRDTTADSE